MSWRLRLRIGALAAALLFPGCTNVSPSAKKSTVEESPSLKRIRQVFARVRETLAKNHKTFVGPDGPVSGFGAGDAYPQIWLRDSSWIVDAAGAYYPRETLTSWLDLHLAEAAKGGRLRDWVAKGPVDTFREWAPRAEARDGMAFDTNSNESDQESSAALAYCRTERLLGAAKSSDDRARSARFSKLVAAMDALLRDRTDGKTGLVWSGLTADWGDVSPRYPDQRAIYFDPKTPRTLGLYTNVLVYAALDCLAALDGPEPGQDALAARARKLQDRIRTAFWMKDRGYFRIRRPLDPVLPGFRDDDDRFALGGNALAALFGIADDAQAGSIFATAERLRLARKFSTISTVLIPPYPAGVFQHPAMREPFKYQNGGQWDWWGAALIEAEFERGHSGLARLHLDQIVSRTLRAGPGLHEWYGQDGLPQGSATYAASGASIYNAVVKGLLGVSRSSAGYRVVMRAGETVLPFEVAQRASSVRLVVSQTVTARAIELSVQADIPIAEVCSVLPPGSLAEDPTAGDMAGPQRVRRIGNDTLVCADVSSSPPPVRVRFAIARPQ